MHMHIHASAFSSINHNMLKEKTPEGSMSVDELHLCECSVLWYVVICVHVIYAYCTMASLSAEYAFSQH